MASTIASTSQSSGGSSAVGSASASASASTSTTVAPFTSFSSYIDSRILRALSSLGYTHPTPVQSHVFPLAISENKDILARARTGSGKTYAYAIPAIQKIINVRKALDGGFTGNEDWLTTRVLILVPTRELAEQVASHIRLLCGALREQDEIRIANIAGGAGAAGTSKGASDKTQRLALADRPDIVIATPSRALVHLRSGSLQLNLLECLIIDEADLILSYGHSSDDIRSILSGGSSSSTSTSAAPSTSASTGSWSLPAVYQSFLMSATLTGEVDELKSVVLRNPVTIKLSDAQSAGGGASGASAAGGGLTQYSIRTTEDDKFLLIYVILKLKLVKGKVLIFVNDTDRGYRLKLFLERFGIRSGVLNAELPFNSRYHAVQEFNRGVFNYLIATDESGLEGLEKDEDDEESEVEGERQQSKSQLISTQMDDAEDADEVAEDDDATGATGRKRKAADDIPAPRSKSKKKRKAQYNKTTSATEYGVTRGIDFVDVACVINFDLPASSRSYTHRIGRTARAGRSGMSLSFVVPRAQWGPSKQRGGFDTSLKSAKRDEKIWKRIERDQRAAGVLTGPNAGSGSSASGGLQEYRFDMTQVEGFRYRMEDALRSVTRASVREARIKEIKNEVLNSEKLKAHFEDNPKDLEFLKHDKPIAGPGGSRTNSKHMKHVPSYLMPRIAPVGGATASSSADVAEGAPVPATKSSSVPLRKKNAKDKRGGQKGGKGFQKGKKADPLKSFRRK